MTLVEAFANGLPAIVPTLGSLQEIVEPKVTGAHFVANNELSLAHMVDRVFGDPEALQRMSVNARATYETKYSAEHNLSILEQIYADAAAA